MVRARWVYAAATLAVIALGLASRRWPVLGKYPGDILYAVMMFCAVGALLPRAPTWRIAALALSWCVAVEFAKLGPALDWLRANPYGRLVLGSAFSWANLGCYAAGVMAGAGVEVTLRVNSKGLSAPSSIPDQD
jgi:hypothetical protein